MKKLIPTAYGLLIVCLALSTLGCPGPAPESDDGNRTWHSVSVTSDEVTLTTEDGVEIFGTFITPGIDTPVPVVLLVHQYGLDRSSYLDFQAALVEVGIASLAIDMRGHGESTAGGTLEYSRFTQTDWTAAANDIKAGLDYLRSSQACDWTRLGVVGASISANLAVVAAADEIQSGQEIVAICLVLLSPGVSYHGIMPSPRASDLGHTPVLIVSAEDDRQSYPGSQSLSQAARNARLESLEGDRHGTDLWSDDPGVMDLIIEWLGINLVSRTYEPNDGNTTTVGEDTETDPQEENE